MYIILNLISVRSDTLNVTRATERVPMCEMVRVTCLSLEICAVKGGDVIAKGARRPGIR